MALTGSLLPKGATETTPSTMKSIHASVHARSDCESLHGTVVSSLSISVLVGATMFESHQDGAVGSHVWNSLAMWSTDILSPTLKMWSDILLRPDSRL